jgi:stage V sporulation protein D (sporulation-specific penicillin-binding protein)
LESQHFPFIQILSEYYVYVVPTKSTSPAKDKAKLQQLLSKYGYSFTSTQLDKLFQQQVYRYIKLFSAANPQIAQEIKNLKNQYYGEKSKDNVPVLHGVILEPYTMRYYPRGEFMSNILGYVDKNGEAFYGIEKYFDDALEGIDGQIKGRASSFLGSVGANDFEVINAKDGDDIFLTIDIGIQKEVESIAQRYLAEFKADSVSVLVYDPNNGEVKASVQAPSFNPNNYNDAYVLKPLGQEEAHIVDDLTYIDIPVYILSGGKYKQATIAERQDLTLEKYIATNIYGAQVFMDRNISVPFEPGSIFKAFTMTVGLDTDEIRQYDYYQDDGQVIVGPYIIKNATSICMGNHTFLHAFVNSCNVGMIRVVQKVGKEIFYNYLAKLGFGKLTGIELAEEKAGSIDNETTVSVARFFNNAFGQGLTTTQIQLAAAYGAIVNGGKYIKPTIIHALAKKTNDTTDTVEVQETSAQVLNQLIRPEVSAEMKQALLSVLEQNAEVGDNAKIPGYLIGAKSGTSQISYRGKPQRGNGWTQGTFVGVVSVDTPQYVVLVRTSRPRTNQW